MDVKVGFLFILVSCIVYYCYYCSTTELNGTPGYITEATPRPFVFYTIRPFDVNEYISKGDHYYLIEPGYYYSVASNTQVNVKGLVYFPSKKIKCESIKCLIKK